MQRKENQSTWWKPPGARREPTKNLARLSFFRGDDGRSIKAGARRAMSGVWWRKNRARSPGPSRFSLQDPVRRVRSSPLTESLEQATKNSALIWHQDGIELGGRWFESSHCYDNFFFRAIPYLGYPEGRGKLQMASAEKKKEMESKLDDLMIKQLMNSILITICVVEIRFVLVSQHSNVKKFLEIISNNRKLSNE